MIQRFDTEAQHEIRNSLDELCTLLEQALRLLKRIADPKAAAQPKDQPNSLSSSSTSATSGSARSISSQATTLTLKASEPHLSSKRSTIQLLKWSFRDKKDISAIVGKFADVNDRLLEMIRFWSLASAIGVDLRHLEHLQKDEDAVMLGLHEDASLALALSDTGYVPRNFELDKCWDGVLQESGTMGDPFAVFQWNGRHILRENCLSLPIEAASIDPQTRNRINSLTQLLNQPKEELFCILRCEGWRVLPHSERITYLYEIPVGRKPDPESLLRLLNNANTTNVCPSLDVKFNLAYSLARSIAQLHMVKWAGTQTPKTIPFTDARPNIFRSTKAFEVIISYSSLQNQQVQRMSYPVIHLSRSTSVSHGYSASSSADRNRSSQQASSTPAQIETFTAIQSDKASLLLHSRRCTTSIHWVLSFWR